MSTISSSTTSTTAFGVTADTTGALVIQTGATPTTALTIDTSQNVGIGTTSINTKLNVKASGNSYITGALSLLDAAGTNKNYITAVSGNIYFGENSSVDCAVINIYGVGLGGNTPQSGLGVRFPATQSASSDANTLDDYEEGTWTPTVSFSGGNGTLSYTSRVGGYVKIGSTVFISMSLTINKGTASGTLDSISGLPFSSNINSGGGAYVDNFTALTGGPEWTIASGGTLMYFYISATGSATAINATSFSTASVLRAFASYTTSS
jgi:hypothetical protein